MIVEPVMTLDESSPESLNYSCVESVTLEEVVHVKQEILHGSVRYVVPYA